VSHIKHNSPYLYVRLKRLKRHNIVTGYHVHAKAGRLWWRVGRFKTEDEAINRLVDIAEMIR